MADKLKTIVIFSEERLRKEYRHILSKVEFAKIEQEVLKGESILNEATLEELASLSPHVFVVDLPKARIDALELLHQIHHNHPAATTFVAGDSPEPEFLIEAMRFGVKEFFLRPIPADKLNEAYRRLVKRFFDEVPARPPAAIYSFLGSKGGNGTTTVATNFAVSLSRLSKKRVLILDLDTQLGDVADFFGVKDNRYLLQEGTDASVWEPGHISRTIVSHSKTGIDLLSLTNGFSRNALSFPAELKLLLSYLQKEYDFIVVDTCNLFENNTIAALDASDLIFLVSKCSLPALRNSQKVLHVFDRLGYPASRIRLLINRYSKGDEIDLKQVEKTLRFSVFWTMPNDFKSIISSIQAGLPLTARSQTLPFARAFYEMSAQVLGTKTDKKAKPPDRGILMRAKDSVPKPAFTTLNLLNS